MYNTATIQLTFTLHMLQMYAVKLKEKCNILNLKDFWKHSNLLILFCIFIVGVYRCIHSFYIYFTVNISIKQDTNAEEMGENRDSVWMCKTVVVFWQGQMF